MPRADRLQSVGYSPGFPTILEYFNRIMPQTKSCDSINNLQIKTLNTAAIIDTVVFASKATIAQTFVVNKGFICIQTVLGPLQRDNTF